MAIKKLFKSYIPSLNYVTQKGRTCVFEEGRFLTDNPHDIAELTQMVNDKSNPHIYIDPDESEIDTTLQERIRKAQEEATLRVLAEHTEGKDSNPQEGSQQSQGAQNAAAAAQGSMSPAALLKVTSSASLGGLAQLSNQK